MKKIFCTLSLLLSILFTSCKIGNIKFEDTMVEVICLREWDTNHNGKLSYKEAASVIEISYAFQHTDISTFEEIKYFVGLKSIGENAFYGCSSLASITIPDSVTSIGSCAFEDCSSLASITIPEGVTSIGDHAFQRYSSLASITIPEGVTSIGDYAFQRCSSLASITIPDSVTSIGSCAFEDCSSLASITIPEGVASIGDYAFQRCSSLASITIPNSVTSIGYRAFSYCSSLASVTIGYGVDSIGKYAFKDCSSLESITIPKSIASIGKGAFEGCDKLKEKPTNWWIGNWNCSTPDGDMCLFIEEDKITEILDGYMQIGAYSITNNVLRVKYPNDGGYVTTYKLDEGKRRISAGEGYWFYKD